MIHYSCDICGRNLNAETERRYEVKLEIRPVPAEQEFQDGMDRIDEMDPLELLEQLISSDEFIMPELIEQPRTLKYDLCGCCHSKFLADPLGRKALLNIHFSAN